MTIKELKEMIEKIDDGIEVKLWATCDERGDTEVDAETAGGYILSCHTGRPKVFILTRY
jgi:hypothetical protein